MPHLSVPAAMLISSGVSALGGVLANRKSKAKSTSTSTPTLSPELQPLQRDLISQISERMKNPGAGLEPVRLGLMEGVNRRYQNLPGKITTQLAQRGMAKSGQLGANLKGVELSRMFDLGDIDTKIAELTQSRGDAATDLASRFLSASAGRTTTGESTQPGNMLGGAVGAGSETLSMLMMMDKLMKGGSAGGGGASSGGGFSDTMGLPMNLPSSTFNPNMYSLGNLDQWS